MKVETYACDVCGTHRKEANHWWRAYRVKSGGLAIVPFETFTGDIGLAAGLVVGSNAELCGEECAMKHISKNLFGDQEANR